MQTTKSIFDAYESRSWRAVARRQRAQGMEFVVGRRDGAYVWDAEGTRRLLDCSTSGGVHALGHRNPELLAALREALDQGLDGGLWMFPNAPHLALQDRLAATAPGRALCRSVITLAASASNDLALLFAFRMTGRDRIIAYRHGYHGHGGFAALVTGSRDEGISEYYGLTQEYGRFFET
jgi:putrescine aminotransferase